MEAISPEQPVKLTQKEYQRAYYLKNRDRIRQKSQELYAANGEKIRAYMREYMRRYNSIIKNKSTAEN